MQYDYDAIIIGGGHNGLTCAGYLARAGIKVLILERRHLVGGAATTEEFYPGFKNSICSYVVTLLHPQVISDLELERHGLRILKKQGERIYPSQDGDVLCLTADQSANEWEMDRRAPGDGASYAELQKMLLAGASVVRPLLTQLPADHSGGIRELFRGASLANALRKLSGRERDMCLKLFTMSAGDLLNEYFDGERVKGMLGYSSFLGSFQGPYTPGSAFLMLYFAIGRVEPHWPSGVPVGGMGAITQAMARSAQEKGVVIKVSSPVAKVLVEGHKAVGVVLDDGSVHRSRVVIGNLAPTRLFGGLVDPSELPVDFRRHMKALRCRSGILRLNVALSELPQFTGVPASLRQQFSGASVILSPTLQYLDQAFDDAKRFGWSRKPVIQMAFESTLDDTLAPAGHHVAHVEVQQCNPDLPEGESWDECRDRVADLAVQTIDELAPNFARSILGRQIISPKDLDVEFGLPNGDVYHGALGIDQMYALRPATGYAHYRSPVANLYMCGAGTHPGGGVSGIPGWNAAREIIKDFRKSARSREFQQRLRWG